MTEEANTIKTSGEILIVDGEEDFVEMLSLWMIQHGEKVLAANSNKGIVEKNAVKRLMGDAMDSQLRYPKYIDCKIPTKMWFNFLFTVLGINLVFNLLSFVVTNGLQHQYSQREGSKIGHFH